MSNILIIDDERAIRAALKDLLEFEGFQVTEAEDGHAGLDAARKNHFDLVLCDIKMPGMDGLECLAQLQSMYPDLPVIMISGHGTMETVFLQKKK